MAIPSQVRSRRGRVRFALFLCLVLSISLIYGEECLAVPVDTGAMEVLMKSPGDLVSSDMLQADPKASLLVLAEVRFKQGIWQEAARYATLLLSMKDGNIKAHGIMGVIHALTGQEESARNELAFLNNAGDQGFLPDLIDAILKAQEGNLDGAESALTSALGKDPRHPVSLYYAGSLHLAKGALEEAADAFDTALGLSPGFPAALAGLGQISLMQERVKEAESQYRQALEGDPANLLYRRTLIEIYRKLKDQKAADAETKKALYYMPGVRENYLQQGMRLLSQGAFKEAIRFADEMEEIYRDLPEALYIKAASQINLDVKGDAGRNIDTFVARQWGIPQSHHYAGMCYLALGQIDRAEEHFKIVISMNPGMGRSFVPLTIIEQLRGNYQYALQGLRLTIPEGEPPLLMHYLMGHVRLAMDDREGYREEMGKAVGLVPGFGRDTGIHVPAGDKVKAFTDGRNLMALYFYNGWYGKALQAANGLLEIDGHDPYAWYFKALASLSYNDQEDAIQAFNELLRVEEDLSAARMELGRLYLQAGDSGKAVEAFKRVVAKDPQNVAGHIALGDALVRQDQEEQAVASYKKAIEINPAVPVIYLKIAMLLAENTEGLDDALQYASEAEEMVPDDPYVADVLGWIYLKRGESKKALEILLTASRLLPGDPVVLYHLGMAYHRNGEKEPARETLRKALAISPDFRGAEEAAKTLAEIVGE